MFRDFSPDILQIEYLFHNVAVFQRPDQATCVINTGVWTSVARNERPGSVSLADGFKALACAPFIDTV